MIRNYSYIVNLCTQCIVSFHSLNTLCTFLPWNEIFIPICTLGLSQTIGRTLYCSSTQTYIFLSILSVLRKRDVIFFRFFSSCTLEHISACCLFMLIAANEATILRHCCFLIRMYYSCCIIWPRLRSPAHL